MELLEIAKQNVHSEWILDEILSDRLIYRSQFIKDPFACIEIVESRNKGQYYALVKGDGFLEGIEIIFQKELNVGRFLSLAAQISANYFDEESNH